MLSDFHLHSCFSGDSQASPEEIINKAISLKMPYLCITDHQDFDYVGDIDFSLDVDTYFERFSDLREQYADKIQLLIGVETGLEPHLSEELDALILSKPFDFIIGSSHLVNRVDPFYPEYWANRSEEDGALEYFNSIENCLKTCHNFDVYGHLDYVMRYSPSKGSGFSYHLYKDILDEILKKLIYLGKGIELNTGGLARGLAFPNPHPDILKRYAQLGGEIITVGSDAHFPEFIGNSFDVAKEMLKNAGFKYYTIFKQRKPEFIKL